MAGKSQFGQKDERRADRQQQGGNLGQKEAGKQQQAESELAKMGEKSRQSGPTRKDKQQS